ncbi:MAG: c-type cytochrome [Saprospiraceae bacterium]|nr:c-type cytochrome [Saprospiraceae bacterium]
MKKAMKIIGYLLGSIVLLLAACLAFFHFKGVPQYEYAPPEHVKTLQVTPDSARLARGAAIGAMHCMECHAAADGKLVGKPMNDLPPMFGKINTLNITQDPVHGIGAWTDGELYYFLRTGIHKDGHWSPPFMPKYSLMADEDLHSVIAWLRSDDPRLAPDSREYPPNRFNLFIKTLSNILFKAPPLPEKPIVIPDASNKIAFGKYVADNLSNCYMCHSGDILKANALHPEQSFGYYGGGTEMRNEAGEPVFSANLTMDKETGLGNWTEQQFIEAVRFGKKPDGGMLSRPMAPHSMLTDEEVSAIFAYLKTVPVIKNPVQRYQASVER